MIQTPHKLAACIAGLGAAATCTFALSAAAEDLSWDRAKQLGAVSVRERAPEAYRPDGIRIGNYLLFPEVGFKTTWIDNILDTPTDKKADFRHEVNTALKFESHLPRHLLDFMIGGRGVRYQEHDEIQYLDGFGTVKWRVDIDHAYKLFGVASIELRHQENVEEELPRNTKAPPEYVKTTAEAGVSREVGRLFAAVGLRYAAWDYKDVQNNLGETLDQDNRDVWIASPFVKFGYRFSPGYRLLGELVGHHQENRGNGLIDRDARGLQGMLGLEFEVSPLVRMTLKGGYLAQDYLQEGLIDINTPVWDGKAEWLVTPLVTLAATTTRNVVTSSFGDSSGRLVTQHGVRADYEAWRNLIISGEMAFRTSDYIGADRLDSVIVGRIAADYNHTKNWLFSVAYEHQQLTSTESVLDRAVNKVSVEMKYRY